MDFDEIFKLLVKEMYSQSGWAFKDIESLNAGKRCFTAGVLLGAGLMAQYKQVEIEAMLMDSEEFN